MIAGGVGGANTTTGTVFEKKTDLRTALRIAGYDLPSTMFFAQTKFCSEMSRRLGYNIIGSLWSKEIRPDECLIIDNHIYIVEKKFQQTQGSTDEKPCGVAFKRHQFDKLSNALGMKISYCYLFNDFFKHPKYKDMLDFIEYYNCKYFFNEIPIEYFEELS